MAEIDISREVATMKRAMASMLAKARAAGIANPTLYFESEGYVHLMDRDHPDYDAQTSGKRQRAVVAQGFLSPSHDVGAW